MILIHDRRHPASRGGRICRWWFGLLFAASIGGLPLAAETARSRPLTPAVADRASQALITLPAPPAWDRGAPATVSTIEEIKAEFAKVTDTPPQVNFIRTSFLLPNPTWLTHFKGWFRALGKPLKIKFEDQLFDCDNYANCFVAFADLLALRSGEARAPFCIGWATVYYQRPFAGITSGAHAVVIAGTTQGLYVIEPQDGTMVPLRQFPNRHTIEAVYF